MKQADIESQLAYIKENMIVKTKDTGEDSNTTQKITNEELLREIKNLVTQMADTNQNRGKTASKGVRGLPV